MTAAEPLPTESWEGIRFFDSEPSSTAGDALLLLHGLGNSLDYWTQVVPLTRPYVRTVAVDIPGFGQSPTPPGGLRLGPVTDVLERFAVEHGLEGAAIVGHSMGGYVALALAGRTTAHPPFVALIGGTLHGVVGIVTSPLRAIRAPRLACNLLAQFVGGVVPLGAVGAGLLDRSALLRCVALWPFVAHPSRLERGSLANALRNNGGSGALSAARVGKQLDIAALFAAVDAPVRLLWGSRDRLVSEGDLAAAREALPVKDVRIIDDCAHWPMLEAPGAVADFLLAGFEHAS